MKQWKKYPFFLMILVSSLIYGGGHLLERQKEPEAIGEIKNIATETSAEAELASPKGTGPKTVLIPETTLVMEVASVSEAQLVPQVQNVPEEKQFQRVEMDYLDDALFIGDSRTSTLYEYAGWENTDFFVKYGQSVWDVWDNEVEGTTLENMLKSKQYGKIYIMLGINELGTGTPERFAEQFGAIVAKVQQLQPDAVIFVEAIMHVTDSKDAENTYINNQEINARNERLKTLADNKKVFYIDVNEAMDEPGTGKLKEEYSFDGVHLQVKYIEVWREFLLNHGIK